LKRLLALAVLACVTAAVLVSAAPAGGIRDWEPCPDSNGLLTCPPGQEGVPYSIKFRSVEEPVCRPGDDTWHIINGSVPPGLSLGLDGTLSGTPTQAGSYRFWVEMRLPDIEGVCNGTADTSQEEFGITIAPGIPRLVIGPETTSPGTVGLAYSLQMTASVSDPKTWTINSGVLPAGLELNPSTGLISGTPTTPGSYTFEVLARMNADARADTKVLGITVRDALAISATDPFSATRRAPAEVSAPFSATLGATGGEGTYTWSLASGTLPPGLTFAAGVIEGTPTVAGDYRFVIRVVDAEARSASYPGRVTVAAKLTFLTPRLLAPATAGRSYRAKLTTTGGVKPVAWRLVSGPLPRGIRFDRFLGVLSGFPTRPGRYTITIEARDELDVVTSRTFRLVVKPAPKPIRTTR
jgi:hypothetical protein